MLDATTTAQLKQYLALLREPVELVASLDDSAKSAEMRELLEEIAAASDKVTIVSEPDHRTPSFGIRRSGTPVSVRFAGIPMGHEFSSLVLALIQVGGHPPKLDEATIAAVRALPATDFISYVSLTCQNCPTVVQALNTMSVLNPGITHVMVEGGTFTDEVTERNVLAVPTVFANGELLGQGRMDIADFLTKLDPAAVARQADELNDKEPFDVLVIGGGPAAAAAAVYAARKGVRTGMVAEEFGGQVLETAAIENLISVPQTDGPKLGAALVDHVQRSGAEMVRSQRATRLVPGSDGLHSVEFESGATLRGRTVIAATGAHWRELGVPGESEYRNKGVTFCPHCDGPLFKGKRVAVVGGGNSGVEAAIDLAGVVAHVTVVEFMDELKADDVLERKLRSLPNAEIILGAQITEIVGDGTAVTGVRYVDRATRETKLLGVEGVFVQIGLVPNTAWAAEAVELSNRGEITIDALGRTSVPGIFGAGDCASVPYKQIIIAMGSGATASLSAFNHLTLAEVPVASG